MRHFVFLAFVNMAASNFHALQTAPLLLPERLGEVRRCAISHTGEVRRCAISRTPIPSLLGGLLSENEAGQLSLRPWWPLKQ